MRAATVSAVSMFMSDRSIAPTMMYFPGRVSSTEQSRLDWAVSMDS